MGFTRWQWYYNKTQMHISHKISYLAQTKHGTQSYTNKQLISSLQRLQSPLPIPITLGSLVHRKDTHMKILWSNEKGYKDRTEL
jgi:hypothetical protein